MSVRLVLSLLITSAMLPGCYIAPPPAGPPTPPVLYYRASIAVDDDEAGEFRRRAGDAEGLSPDAARLLRPGVTIAFYPPDSCEARRDPEVVQGTKVREQEELLALTCGTLMSQLEAEAARGGFEVVTWQALRDSTRAPLEVARRLGVAIVIEVNEFSVARGKQAAAKVTGMRFSKQFGPDDAQAVAVSRGVAARCKGVMDRAMSAGPTERLEAVLDAKAVHVESGRAVWHYQRMIAEHGGAEDAGTVLDQYYPAAGVVAWKPAERSHKGKNKRQRVGTLLAAIGGPIGIVGGGSYVIFEPVSAGILIAAGVGMIAGGVTLILLGNREQRRDASRPPQYPQPRHESAEAVVCAVPAVQPPWLGVGPGVAPVTDDASSTHAFRDVATPVTDPDRERRSELVKDAATDFVLRLGRVTGSLPVRPER